MGCKKLTPNGVQLGCFRQTTGGSVSDRLAKPAAEAEHIFRTDGMTEVMT